MGVEVVTGCVRECEGGWRVIFRSGRLTGDWDVGWRIIIWSDRVAGGFKFGVGG